MFQAITNALNTPNPSGFWLIHGDEPLVATWVLDAWRAHWQKNQVERKRMDGKSAKSWREALSEFSALSLFSSQTVVELHTSHKPDKKGLTALEQFATSGDENCLIVMMPTQDWRAQKTVFFKTAQRIGTVLDTSIKTETQRKQLLEIKAKELCLSLEPSAWQLLLGQTQHNLLAAYQALWRASDLVLSKAEFDGTKLDGAIGNNLGLVSVSADALKPALVMQSRYSVHDLSDAVLAGKLVDVVDMLRYLRQSAEAPSLVLWTLASEARKIHGLQAGATARDLGIWQSKARSYQAAARRTPYKTAQSWTHLCLEIDRSIKGLSPTPAWELINQLSLSMAGKDVFLETFLNVQAAPIMR